jgi:ElaB/YqjD/DUF883 family membrane-anchored ribosome-binding protein
MPTSESGYDPSISTMTSKAKQVGEFVSGMRNQAQNLKEQYIDDAWITTRDYVRNNPGKTILIAAAVGVVLGSFLRRR